jgi:chemotaxis signal transduction protein
MIWRLPPLLRGLMTTNHVVGVAEIDGELAWLVDARRFFPTSSAG